MEASTEVRKTTASAALAHPLRVQIVTIANHRPLSPTDFLDVMRPRPISPDKRKSMLSLVSYHFRTLEKAGAIEVVETVPRRGSVEHVYRGAARAHFTDEEWASMTPKLRCKISTAMFQGFAANVEEAMLAHTFDARDDRWLAWTHAQLDERGWGEMTTTIATNFAELERIREESEVRLVEDIEEEPIPAVFAMFGFEAPPSR